jgi:hypothetical protein
MKFVAKPSHFHAAQTQFLRNQKFCFPKIFAKVSSFRKESFAKTKSEFCKNFREKKKAKTFVPTLYHTVFPCFKGLLCFGALFCTGLAALSTVLFLPLSLPALMHLLRVL